MGNSIYLKPSGRFYYAAFFIAFLAVSLALYALAGVLPFNAYQAMFELLVLYFVLSGGAFLYFQQQYVHAEDEMLTVKEGVVTSRMVVIPFNKISEVKTQYGLWDTILGVGTVVIDTAGNSGVQVVFSHVPRDSIIAFLAMFRNYRGPDEAQKKGAQ